MSILEGSYNRYLFQWPHFSLGPATPQANSSTFPSPVPTHFTDLRHITHGPAIVLLRTCDTNPTDLRQYFAGWIY